MVATATPRGRRAITKWGVTRLNVRHTEEGVLWGGGRPGGWERPTRFSICPLNHPLSATILERFPWVLQRGRGRIEALSVCITRTREILPLPCLANLHTRPLIPPANCSRYSSSWRGMAGVWEPNRDDLSLEKLNWRCASIVANILCQSSY